MVRIHLLSVPLLIFALSACDLEGRKKCVWVLEPEPNKQLMDRVEEGMIPVCARNRETQKQDCRLQISLEKAKKFSEKRFRYVDMKIKDFGIPRTILDITFCD
jgi:hypothetical protein